MSKRQPLVFEEELDAENTYDFLTLFCIIERAAQRNISERIKNLQEQLRRQKNGDPKKIEKLSIELSKAQKKNENIPFQKWDRTIPSVQENVKAGFIKELRAVEESDQSVFYLTEEGRSLGMPSHTSNKIQTFTLGVTSTTEATLGVLKKITTMGVNKKDGEKKKNLPSSDVLLRPALAESTSRWAYHVPRHFNAPLGISLQIRRKKQVSYWEYVQNGVFSFDVGDIFYRSEKEHEKGMDGLQIQSASPVSIIDGERYPGHVTFRYAHSKITEEMTQDEFVYFLIFGDKK